MSVSRLRSVSLPRLRPSVEDGGTDRPAGRTARSLWLALPFAAALGLAAFAVVTLWFVQLDPGLDDLGLYNPIYLFAHTGQLAYPIYPAQGAEHAYFVHPPGDAVLVGSMQWLTGWPAQTAAIAALLLLLFAAYLVVVWSRFSLPAKFAMLFGLSAVVVVWASSFLRPDARLAVSFLGGLLALEAGRLANWSPGRLFLGALLVSGSATLHYPGSLDVFAVGVYAVWVVWERRTIRNAARPLVALGLGTALVMVPYLFLFLVPYWTEIVTFARAASNQYNGVTGAFGLHRRVYHFIYEQQIGGPFLTALAAPFTRFGIPLVFVTTPVLFWRRETRGIGIASVPGFLFLLFFTHTKVETNTSYYMAEFALYYCCVGYLAILAVVAVARRLARARPGVAFAAAVAAGALVVASVVLLGKPQTLLYGDRNWHPTHADMELARAATAPTLPSNSLVLFNPALNLWYTTGGWSAYPIWRDIHYAADLSPFNLRAYFSGFTAIAGGENETWDVWSANNKQHKAIGNWYASGMLKPFRFYFGHHRRGFGSAIRYLLFSTRRQPLLGHVLNGHTMERYVESPGGPYVLVSGFCDVKAEAVKRMTVPQQAPIFLPGTTNVDPYVDEQHGNRRFAMQTFLTTRSDYEHHWRPSMLRDGCRIGRVAPLRLASRRPVSQVLREYERIDSRRVMRFPSYVQAAGRLFAPASATLRFPGGASISRFQTSAGAILERRGSTVVIQTPEQLYAEGGQIALRKPADRRSWVVVRGRVTRGQISLCILSAGQCSVRRSLPAGAAGPFYIPVAKDVPAAGLQLFIGNEASSRSVLELADVSVVAAVKAG